MKIYIYIFFLFVMVNGCGTNKDGSSGGKIVKVISVDIRESRSNVDISDLFEESIEVIKLETSDNCLIGNKGKKIFTDDYIFISDKMSKKIHLFDFGGHYIRSIGMVGRAPGEYIALGDYVVTGDSVYVQDAQSDKVIVYAVTGEKISEFTTNPPIYYDQFLLEGHNLYFITGYGYSGSNYCNLIRQNLTDGSRKYFLPFDKEILQKKQTWGLNQQYAGQYKDTTLLIYPRTDTIYSLSNDAVSPQYMVNFITKKIPGGLLQKEGSEILMKSIEEGYILGLEQIWNTKNYIMATFGEGNKNHTFIYGKNDRTFLLSDSFVLKDIGDLIVSNFSTTDKNECITTYDAMLFLQMWRYVLSKGDFKNKENKEKIQKVIESLQENDNPVLVKLKFK